MIENRQSGRKKRITCKIKGVFIFNIFKKAFNMKQNVHAINTTILKYAKPEGGMKGKAFENKTILKQMEQKTKKNLSHGWLFVPRIMGNRCDEDMLLCFSISIFLFFFSSSPTAGQHYSTRECVFMSWMSEFNSRHVRKNHVLHASSWIAGHVFRVWLDAGFLKPPPKIPKRLHDLFLGSVQKCVHCIIVVAASGRRSVRSGAALPPQSCIGSNVLKWEFCFVLVCFLLFFWCSWSS